MAVLTHGKASCSVQVTILLGTAIWGQLLLHLSSGKDSYAGKYSCPTEQEKGKVCRQQLPGGERKGCLHWDFSSPYSSNGIPVLAFIPRAENHNFAFTSEMP